MLVKICGIKTKEAAETAVAAGADFIGFMFAESKRKIEPLEALAIAREIPNNVKKVGVFVNEKVERMIEIGEVVGLDYLQLHGDEPAEIAEKLPYKIIKAFPADAELANIQSYPCDYYLIDSPKGQYRGGNGKTFDWTLLNNINIQRDKIILAGGLNSENVQQAIKTTSPAGVDVSSGVETNGEKDQNKIKQFIKQAKQQRKDEFIDNLYNAR